MHRWLLTSDSDLRRLGDRFCSGELTRSEWTHAAHLAAATYLIGMRPDLCPEREMPHLIRALNIAHGVNNTGNSGYHHTITLASLGAVRTYIRERDDLPLFEAANTMVETRFGAKEWLFEYWTRDRLLSSSARSGWLAPDLKALPFEVRTP